MKQFLRQLPAVHELQKDKRFIDLIEKYETDTEHFTLIIKEVLNDIRKDIVNGKWNGPEPGTSMFIDKFFELLDSAAAERFAFTLKRVINATGTILHTNLGRARLSESAVNHVVETAKNYSNLEYKLQEGERGSRHSHVETLVKEVTGAEAAMVVNNNAAAVYLIMSALAKNKEVIVSRGQLVEIGGSFRISSIMEESGAHLVEVGTTNKTHLYDYENAINDNTGMIMKVHTSNFKIYGFSKTVETEELAQLSEKHDQIVFYEDLGSGVLYDFSRHGIGDEPIVGEVLKMGADIVSFSGDKLLGGPQAGIIAGKKSLIDQLKKHQLARVVRVDKMTLAALEGTLMDYLKGEQGFLNIPTLRDLLVPLDELKDRSDRFIREINALNNGIIAVVAEGTSQVGGGTMPDVHLPTLLVTIRHPDISAEHIARKLRTEHSPAIVVRIQKEEVHIDLRTVTAEEESILLNAIKTI
ncbi:MULTISPECIES: L-seryl-tRNA(Sec) selenium transferase [Mesobacillus]|uniref:L-seryl-tRNA(Sec) selenium transferase n=1 Tax=Mesobacillus selenatarsenatis TaxID=388741 RepID=A0A846TG13_9BACI|nr:MULTISPECIES: L-seryl-tRNA(Sec) selenium transferase [Mesobacillus]NKE04357.1 L-seryl-tRNA(Sec) selenium transferase [Mesobacillus selenatarsenatis]